MFDEIKKDSQKAWAKFEDYAIENPDIEADIYNYSDDFADDLEQVSIPTLIGHLELFFDEQGIYVEIENINENSFCWEITNPTTIYEHGFNKSRTEAWQSAIPKAFEILEKSL